MTASPESETAWNVGQKVRHPGKPEWGTGTVQAAQWTTQNGVKCQRLTVRFSKGGIKNLSTAFAKLEPADGAKIDAAVQPGRSAIVSPRNTPSPAPPRSRAAGKDEAPPPSKYDDLNPAQARAIMTQVPEPARDPFRSVEDRIRATLKLFGPTPEGGKLLDWATTQSGLEDPLSVFNRHELEQLHETYRIQLDRHLGALITEARRERLDVKAITAGAGQHARRALQRINFNR
ncbi:MAG: DUF3553 domain-containing protein [Planctomycetota bacterium]